MPAVSSTEKALRAEIAALRARLEEADAKQAAAALQKRTEELAILLDVLPAFVWTTHDADCHVITGNSAANELTQTKAGTNVSQSAVASGEAVYLRQLKTDGTEYRADELP